MDSHVEFSDLRGRKYIYSVHQFEDNWGALPGNYIFARRTADGWTPLFVGHTPNFQWKMGCHNDAWIYCRNRGASFVLAHVNHMLAGGLLRLETDAGGVDRYRSL